MLSHKELRRNGYLPVTAEFPETAPVFVPNEPVIIIDDEPTLLQHYHRLFNVRDGGMFTPNRMQLCVLYLRSDYSVITNRFWYVTQKNPVSYYIKEVIHVALNLQADILAFANYAPTLGSGPDISLDSNYRQEERQLYQAETTRIARMFEKAMKPLHLHMDSFYLLNASLNYVASYTPKTPRQPMFF